MKSDELDIDILNTGFIKLNIPVQNISAEPSKIDIEKDKNNESVDENKVNTHDIKNNNVRPAANPKDMEKQATQEFVKNLTKEGKSRS